MATLIVGLLDSRADAEAASRTLESECGCNSAEIAIVVHDSGSASKTIDALLELGVPAQDAGFYSERLSAGAALVVVQPSDEAAARVAQVLRGHLPPQRVRAGESAFQDMTVEIAETAEEAVVEKRARVVEEIVIDKEVTEREETIRDTVRRSQVGVERPERRRLHLAYAGPERRRAA